MRRNRTKRKTRVPQEGGASPAPTKRVLGRLVAGGADVRAGTFQEGREFFAEDFPCGFFGEEDVIGGWKGNEAGAGNFGGEDAAFFGRSDAVAIGVKNNGGNRERGEQGADVDVIASAHDFDEVGGGDGDELEILEPLLVLGGGLFGNIEIGDDLEERGIGFAPVELDEGFESAANLDCVGMPPVVGAARIRTVQNQMGNALRMASGVGNGDGAALRMAEEGEFFQAGGVDNGFQIVDPGFERNILDVPFGEAVGAAVVADDALAVGEIPHPVVPDGAFPFEIEMVETVGDFDERVPGADGGVGETDVVRVVQKRISWRDAGAGSGFAMGSGRSDVFSVTGARKR